MSYFNKNNWILILLVLLNLALLASIWLKPQLKPETSIGILPLFKKELQLDDTQFAQFKSILEQHRNQTRPIAEKIKANKQKMISVLQGDTPDTTRAKQLAVEIASQHQLLEEALIAHYLNLKKICNATQLKQLDEVFDRALSVERKKNN